MLDKGTTESVALRAGGVPLDFLINPQREAFLDDHIVGGTPVLPTVLGLDLVVRSHRATLGGQVTQLRDVVVADPVRFRGGLPRRLAASPTAGSGGDVRWDVRGELPLPHWTAVVPQSPAAFQAAVRVTPGPALGGGAGMRARDLYPPYFHGPAFQVVHEIREQAGVLRARYADRLPELAWSFGPLSYPARLLELVLQTCGVWHLAETGRMMIPWRIGVVGWTTGGPDLTAAYVAVREVGDRGDGVLSGVVTVQDEVVLVVDRYEAVDLGLPADSKQARHIHKLLTTQGAAS